jgi:NAD(P)H-quinone oxidoreductase subunit 5
MADNLLLFLGAWFCCNRILVKLMVHKSAWKAAKASGKLAMQNFIIGFFLMIFAFALMYHETSSVSIQYIISQSIDSWLMVIALIILVFAAMTQSAIWPFHRWLISSANSPTPVSAIMHAGIINGGGFLLARFSPLFFNAPTILTIIFIVGLVSALLGSLWKLMQHDIKRMLACSTMGQMGFMFLQCGLGLFAPALAHLCWHGMFKAYLFLSSGSAAQEKRLDLGYPPTLICFLFSLGCGLMGAYIFMRIHEIDWFFVDTRLFIVGIVFVLGMQLALTVLRGAPFKKLPIAMILTGVMALIYTANVCFFDWMLASLTLIQPQTLNIVHLVGLILLSFAWGSLFFVKYFNQASNAAMLPRWLLAGYVKMLNSSQPHPTTITTSRKEYHYV